MDNLIILIEAASVAIWSSFAIMAFFLVFDVVTGRNIHESKILLQEVYYTLSIGFFVGLFYFGLLKLRLEYPGWF